MVMSSSQSSSQSQSRTPSESQSLQRLSSSSLASVRSPSELAPQRPALLDQIADLAPRIVAALHTARFTTLAQVLHLSSAEIERVTRLNKTDIRDLQSAIARAVLPRFLHPVPSPGKNTTQWRAPTARELLACCASADSCAHGCCVRRLTTGCVLLDRALGGGILSRGITEIVGESATGKSQLALQLCLTVQLPEHLGGLAGCAAFLATESAFPKRRLHQVTDPFVARWRAQSPESLAALVPTGDPRDNIYVQHIGSVDELLIVIERQLERLVRERNVRLVVLDSVAALFRGEYEFSQLSQRAKSLGRIGTCLQELSCRLHVPIVCINQVSDDFRRDGSSASSSSSSSSSSGSATSNSSDDSTMPLLWASMQSIDGWQQPPKDAALVASAIFPPVRLPRGHPAVASAYAHLSGGGAGGSAVIPALGLAWSNLINMRVLLRRLSSRMNHATQMAELALGAAAKRGGHYDEEEHSALQAALLQAEQRAAPAASVVIRSLHIVLAPHLPNVRAMYVIDNDGVKGVCIQ